jgi:predicted transcriptional regulator
MTAKEDRLKTPLRKTPLYSFPLDRELVQAADRLAKHEGLSTAAVLRRAIRADLEHRGAIKARVLRPVTK